MLLGRSAAPSGPTTGAAGSALSVSIHPASALRGETVDRIDKHTSVPIVLCSFRGELILQFTAE
ncbi:MAG: hypothetical protein KDA72_08465 [Planctomycetales bacterium]|nr:hypothetical protein [Planctomycetales bacterium]